jgi:hypothetical protein
MMFRRSVIGALGGYDETLSYEDFDFGFVHQEFSNITTPTYWLKKAQNSLSQNQFKILNKHNHSTYLVL